MIIAQVYNNNVVAVHDEGREVILIGRGLGFQKKRGDAVRPEQVEKRFNLAADDSAASIRGILVDVPYEIVLLTSKVTDYLRRTHGITLTDAVEIGLADHLDAAIKRLRIRHRLGQPGADRLLRAIRPGPVRPVRLSGQVLAHFQRNQLGAARIR